MWATSITLLIVTALPGYTAAGCGRAAGAGRQKVYNFYDYYGAVFINSCLTF